MARRPRCKHFSGLMNDACDAGVKYDAVKVKNGTGQGYSLPCLPHHNQCGATCEKLSLPTPEEIAAEEAADKKRHEDTGKARAAIVAHLGGPWKKGTPGAYGTIECPVCKQGRLNFRRAGVNGHIHAACEMDGCVNWME